VQRIVYENLFVAGQKATSVTKKPYQFLTEAEG
jgi:hypothetical protein